MSKSQAWACWQSFTNPRSNYHRESADDGKVFPPPRQCRPYQNKWAYSLWCVLISTLKYSLFSQTQAKPLTGLYHPSPQRKVERHLCERRCVRWRRMRSLHFGIGNVCVERSNKKTRTKTIKLRDYTNHCWHSPCVSGIEVPPFQSFLFGEIRRSSPLFTCYRLNVIFFLIFCKSSWSCAFFWRSFLPRGFLTRSGCF